MADHVNVAKLASALPEALGKTIAHIVVTEHQGRFQLVLVFTDGTHYEFYGEGWLSGARQVGPCPHDVLQGAWTRSATDSLVV